jgi:hypothetical protein
MVWAVLSLLITVTVAPEVAVKLKVMKVSPVPMMRMGLLGSSSDEAVPQPVKLRAVKQRAKLNCFKFIGRLLLTRPFGFAKGAKKLETLDMSGS